MWATLQELQRAFQRNVDITSPKRRRLVFLSLQALTEIWLIVTVLRVYSIIRNFFGSSAVSPEYAFTNALQVISIEKFFGLFFEQELQRFILSQPQSLILFCNNYYSAMHFVSVVTTLCVLFLSTHDVSPPPTKEHPHRRRDLRPYFYFWRNALLFSTCLGLLGYAVYPLMPPRLITDCDSKYGACQDNFTFVDTLEKIGFGLGTILGDKAVYINWKSKRMQAMGNFYAAMPSLHTAWALWVCFSLRSVVRGVYESDGPVEVGPRRSRVPNPVIDSENAEVATPKPPASTLKRAAIAWAKFFGLFHPTFTVFVIIVTGNHYWLDALGGATVLLVGYYVAPYLPELSTLKLLKRIFISTSPSALSSANSSRSRRSFELDMSDQSQDEDPTDV
eukprot:TRINITY_DN7166_c0_g1_i1.p1 TRINITY_DN7166_c0_g1~~TRINITY_DN7166_c0_g1_i1.p1  ORF type:complete len:414 (-),score=64.28 TRINITY_DN7166_c0_g1_i1:55-1227(-)